MKVLVNGVFTSSLNTSFCVALDVSLCTMYVLYVYPKKLILPDTPECFQAPMLGPYAKRNVLESGPSIGCVLTHLQHVQWSRGWCEKEICAVAGKRQSL